MAELGLDATMWVTMAVLAAPTVWCACVDDRQGHFKDVEEGPLASP